MVVHIHQVQVGIVVGKLEVPVGYKVMGMAELVEGGLQRSAYELEQLASEVRLGQCCIPVQMKTLM